MPCYFPRVETVDATVVGAEVEDEVAVEGLDEVETVRRDDGGEVDEGDVLADREYVVCVKQVNGF